jgi:hypothetical protein
MSDITAVVLGSVAIGALISSLVTGLFFWWSKRAELARQDLQVAVKMTELRHQQMLFMAEFEEKRGRSRKIDVWDPLVMTVEYHRGVKEVLKTGGWQKGEASHTPAKSPTPEAE